MDRLEKAAQTMKPFLIQEFSVKRSAVLIGLSPATAYNFYAQNPEFANKIDRFSMCKAVLFGDIIFRQLNRIHEKTVLLESFRDKLKSGEPMDIEARTLTNSNDITRNDIKFLCWLGAHDKALREEFGSSTKAVCKHESRSEIFDTLDPEKANELANSALAQMGIFEKSSGRK